MRDTEGSQTARRQPVWVIDSTAPDNEGAGTALDPLKTDQELTRRWGLGGSCPITEPTTLTYRQGPTTETDLDVTIKNGGSFQMYGTPIVAIPGVVLTAVTVQNRATNTRWDISAPGLGAHVGKLVEITASAVPARITAYAPILEVLGPNQVVVGPFVVPDPGGFPGYTNVTPAAGDTIKVYAPTVVRLGRLFVRNATRDPETAGPPLRNLFLTDGIEFDGNAANFGAGDLHVDNVFAQHFRTILRDLSVWCSTNDFFTGHYMIGGYVTGLNVPRFFGNGFGLYYACVLDCFIDIPYAADLSHVGDCYYQASAIEVLGLVYSQGVAYFNYAASSGTVFVVNNAAYRQVLGVADWGTNNVGYGIRVCSGGQMIYAVKPAINAGLGAGRETLIGGADTQYAAVPFVNPANNAMIVAFA